MINLAILEDSFGDFEILKDLIQETLFYSYEIFHFTETTSLVQSKNTFNFILSDLNLPDSRGIDTIKILLKAFDNTPIIALTGESDRTQGMNTIKCGAQDYLSKGEFDSKLLWKTINYAIERNQLLNDIKKSTSILQKQTDALEQFAFVATHDLRSPIKSLESLVNIMEQKVNFANDEKAYLENLKQTTTRLDNTLEDLMSILSINENFEDGIKKVSIKTIVEEIIMDLSPIIESSKSRIIIELDKLNHIQSSPAMLKSIMQNLLTNALKYSHKDRTPEIKIISEIRDGNPVIDIIDNGIGIPPKKQDFVFQLFKRLHKDKKGRGIGLFLVKSQIESLGGSIEVKSEEGIGSTFTVKFDKSDLAH